MLGGLKIELLHDSTVNIMVVKHNYIRFISYYNSNKVCCITVHLLILHALSKVGTQQYLIMVRVILDWIGLICTVKAPFSEVLETVFLMLVLFLQKKNLSEVAEKAGKLLKLPADSTIDCII